MNYEVTRWKKCSKRFFSVSIPSFTSNLDTSPLNNWKKSRLKTKEQSTSKVWQAVLSTEPITWSLTDSADLSNWPGTSTLISFDGKLTIWREWSNLQVCTHHNGPNLVRHLPEKSSRILGVYSLTVTVKTPTMKSKLKQFNKCQQTWWTPSEPHIGRSNLGDH